MTKRFGSQHWARSSSPGSTARETAKLGDLIERASLCQLSIGMVGDFCCAVLSGMELMFDECVGALGCRASYSVSNALTLRSHKKASCALSFSQVHSGLCSTFHRVHVSHWVVLRFRLGLPWKTDRFDEDIVRASCSVVRAFCIVVRDPWR